MRFLFPVLAVLTLAGLASAQCPAGAGSCQSVTVTVRQAPAPTVYLPMPAAMPVQAWQVPSARGVQWYVPTTYTPAPLYYAAPVGDCGASAGGGQVEYRYGPLGRLRRVVVR